MCVGVFRLNTLSTFNSNRIFLFPAIDYHGTVEIRPVDKGHSKLLYTLVYDADALPKHEPADKAADKDRRAKQFTGLVATMKAAAEAK